VTPDQIALCQRLAAEAAQYKWARELSDDSRRGEAEDARVEHKVGFRCDPKATRAWWATWQPAYDAALEARTAQRLAPRPEDWGGEVHRRHALTVARYAREVFAACQAFALKFNDGPCWRITEMAAHLDRIEAWATADAPGFIDVSAIVPACVAPVPSLPWVVDPFGVMRHLGHMVATGLSSEWSFHVEQACHAAAFTLASLEDRTRGDKYRAAVPVHLARLAGEVKP
jgi:hypothetical protein